MTLMISNHRLDGAPFKASPNTDGSKLAGDTPDAIIVHFTGGASATSSIESLCDPRSRVSAHVVVGPDGVITQLVPFDTVAWHAGLSSFGGRDGYNRYSVGIEIDNPGRLLRSEDGKFQTWFGRVVKPEDAATLVHRNEQAPTPWHLYTEPQIAAVFELCAVLCSEYPIREILGHEEIAPLRKVDPGPAFPLQRLRDRLLGAGRAAIGPAEQSPLAESRMLSSAAAPAVAVAVVRGYVAVDKLNIRTSAGIAAALAGPALARGMMVDVLDQQPGWFNVRNGNLAGWVRAEYLRT